MNQLAKSKETEKLEKAIWNKTTKMGVFGCFEVTIGWWGKERVDYITYDTKGVWRCYEIKISKSDFYSKSKKTFVGHYNYFVLPTMELYEEVKEDIPTHVGVYVNHRLVKRPRRQELQVDEQVLKNSMIRSLYRETEKLYKSKNPRIIEAYNRKIHNLTQDNHRLRQELNKVTNALYSQYGRNWRDKIGVGTGTGTGVE